MVDVPAGPFLMGCVPSDRRECQGNAMPARTVHLSAFQIDKTEVTVAAYAHCEKAKVCGRAVRRGRDAPDLPITGVTWHDADRYCRWVGRRLPTEAEWEKAARGSDGRSFPWGEAPPTCALAHYASPPGDFEACGADLVVPVGTHPSGASPSGALDLAGNAREWTADWYHPEFYRYGPTNDPTGESSDVTKNGRVVRGTAELDELAVYHRGSQTPSFAYINGFRCARSPVQVP